MADGPDDTFDSGGAQVSDLKAIPLAWEPVYAVNDFWDGPRGGVACVQGVPHIYQSIFDDSADDYLGSCRVSPIAPDVLALVLEDWQIWLRWSDAFQLGEVTLESHPALPADRPRHDEIQSMLLGRLQVDQANCRTLTAQYRHTGEKRWEGWEVAWSAPKNSNLEP